MTSVKKRKILHRKFIRVRRVDKKTTLYNQFKTTEYYKLTKISKRNHYQKCFHEYEKDIILRICLKFEMESSLL